MSRCLSGGTTVACPEERVTRPSADRIAADRVARSGVRPGQDGPGDYVHGCQPAQRQGVGDDLRRQSAHLSTKHTSLLSSPVDLYDEGHGTMWSRSDVTMYVSESTAARSSRRPARPRPGHDAAAAGVEGARERRRVGREKVRRRERVDEQVERESR
jgi:hypothetical protein